MGSRSEALEKARADTSFEKGILEAWSKYPEYKKWIDKDESISGV